MKKYILIAVALTISLLSACSTDPEEEYTPTPSFDLKLLQKEWHLDDWQGEDAEFDLYIEFKEDNTFTIYQQIETIRFTIYNGTYTVDNSEISGVYSDGQNWGSNYTLTFDTDTMQMKSQNETATYKECTIPNSVKESAQPYTPTKSGGCYPL